MKTSKENMYKDEYMEDYASCDSFDALVEGQKELENASHWVQDVRRMEVLPLDNPMEVELLANDPANRIPKDVLLDTADNAGIMLSYNGQQYCLRDCAMPSLLNTAGISGLGIGRADKVNLATGLTAFLMGCREKSKVLHRCGKVAAILSSQYEVMPISTMLELCEGLGNSFGAMSFRGGMVSHALTVASFRFPEKAKQAAATYAAVTGKTVELTPCIQFRASDTSSMAATLVYSLAGKDISMPLGTVKVSHIPPAERDANGNRVTCLAKFKEEIQNIYAKMETEIPELLADMDAHHIDNPGNAFVGLCKYANIPQRWGGIVEEMIRNDFPGRSGCSMLELFEYLCRITGMAVEDGNDPFSKRVLDLEEGILRIASNKAIWSRYDLPGTVAWSQKKFVV